jgi:hypothetical protein
MEQLVIQSGGGRLASRFRLVALDALDAYQLRPAHLPHALSLYATCAWLALDQAGDATAYRFNKAFASDDFQVNIYFSKFFLEILKYGFESLIN